MRFDEISSRLRARRSRIAHGANEAFLERHPEWLAHFGERARTFGEEDAGFHLDFLAAALELGRASAYSDYLRWADSVLSSRGIDADGLHEHVRDVVLSAVEHLPEDARGDVMQFAEEAIEAAAAAGPLEWDAPDDALAVTAGLYVEAALRGDRPTALNIVEQALAQGATVLDVYADVLQRAQYEVGRRWQENRITVAEEHMATAVTQTAMTVLYPRLPRPASRRGSIVVTGVQGELHQVGAHMVSDVLEADGWSVRFVGTQMPQDGVVDLLGEDPPDVVGVSVTIAANLPAARRLIQRVREDDRLSGCRVLAGGAAFNSQPDVAAELGADAHARDLREAILVASRLSG